MPLFSGCRGRLRFSCGIVLILVSATLSPVFAAGEPAKEFINQLRAAKYFDTALAYLDRLDKYPGVLPEFKSAIALEKAQTYIEQAVSSRNGNKRDEYFRLAEEQIASFLKQVGHPRLSEARLKIGKLQLVRATQLMVGEPDDAKRKEAAVSYLAASKTFDEIVETLRAKLKEMQGAKAQGAAAKKQRDQFRGEFLQAMNSAAEARRLAAGTLPDPAKDGKELLEQALKSFMELSENYGGYAQGAIATLQRGQVEEQLGEKEKALDSYIRMLEQPDADALRDAKFQAVNGIIRLGLEKTPLDYRIGIARGQPVLDGARPNERTASSVQDLRIALAQAYLRRSEDTEKLKPVEQKRALSAGRQLLNTASKIPSPQAEKAIEMLAKIGIDREAPPQMPTAEQPESLRDAWEKAGALQQVMEQLETTQTLLKKEPPTPAQRQQITDVSKQLAENRSLARQYLQRGLTLVDTETDLELVNQTRQFLAYLLYKSGLDRDAIVVGFFLARNAPGSEAGLSGGLVALNSLQLLLVKDPNNAFAVEQLEILAEFLGKHWPNEPKAATAQGVIIKFALRDERWEEAQAKIAAMGKGPEQASYQRLMGQLLWNQSIKARVDKDDDLASKLMNQAAEQLSEGLAGIEGNLADLEAAKAALVLAKIYLRQGKVTEASATLKNAIYGPQALIARLGNVNQAFVSEVYSTELQILVQRMALEPEPAQADVLLKRATAVMDKLRQSVVGPDAQTRLTSLYIRASREIREQLDLATGDAKVALVSAFRVFLDKISQTTNDAATLQWVGQTLIDLAEASMQPGVNKANGQAAELLVTAVSVFDRLKQNVNAEVPLTVDFQVAKANRLLGKYSDSINAFASLLAQKPMMLDAQMEAALAYEQWAAVVPKKFTALAYNKALLGGKPDAKKKNIIWGWGKVSQLTSRDLKYEDMFFEARYHVALCRYLAGKQSSDKAVMAKAVTDITKVQALYPGMGGQDQRTKFEILLKRIQTELGQL